MAKVTRMSTYDGQNKQWRTPVDIGVKAENVDIVLTSGLTNDLQSVLGAYNDSTTVTAKLKNIGSDSALDNAIIQNVSENEPDTLDVITNDSSVDIVGGDTIETFAEKYNKRGLHIYNKFQNYIAKTDITSTIDQTSGSGQVPSAMGVYEAIQLTQLLPATVAAHRSIYRGNNLVGADAPFTSIEALVAAVEVGDFQNIFIGDYFDITLPATSLGAKQTVRLIVMDINYYENYGDLRLTKPHLILMPQDCLVNTAAMHSTNVTNMGYAGSTVHTTILPIYAAAFKSVLGNSHVLTYRDFLTTASSSVVVPNGYQGWMGAASQGSWTDVVLRLPNENMVLGTSVVSSSMYDIGGASRQLAGFALNPNLYIKRLGYNTTIYNAWWLSAIANTTDFVTVGNTGLVTNAPASDTNGIVPVIIFG